MFFQILIPEAPASMSRLTRAVRLSDARCASAVYSRPGESYLLLVNLDKDAKQVNCVLRPEALPCPLMRPAAAALLAAGGAAAGGHEQELNVRQLVGPGLNVALPGDGTVVLRVREAE